MPQLRYVLRCAASDEAAYGHSQIHPQRVMTASSLCCVIGWCGGALLAVGLMGPRGVLVMAEEPMDRRWLSIGRPSFQGVVNLGVR